MPLAFVSGASGFLGGHLVRELRAVGCTVRAMSRRPASDAALAALGAEPCRADLTDPASLHAAADGCDVVFHAAADTSMWRRNDARQTATNVDGTANLLRACDRAGVAAFVHTSSVSAFSHLAHGRLDESVTQRGGESWINYERTKYLGERLVRKSSLPWIVFNPSHILGPGDRQNWARLIMMIDRGTLPGIPPGIGAFADVREIAMAQVRAWQRRRFGEGYLVGGEAVAFTDFVQRVCTALGRRTPTRATPAWALMALGRVIDAWSRVSGREPQITPESAALTCHALRVDSAKAKRELDYVETPLDTLLADTLDWMRGEGLLTPSN